MTGGEETRLSSPTPAASSPVSSDTREEDDEGRGSLVDLSLDGVTKHPVTREERLRSIRPFTEDQLLALHPIQQIDRDDEFVSRFLQVSPNFWHPYSHAYFVIIMTSSCC